MTFQSAQPSEMSVGLNTSITSKNRFDGPLPTPELKTAAPRLVWQICSDLDDPAWDSYLERSPFGHHEQTSRWGRVKAHYGWNPVRLKATLGGELVAGVQVLIRRIAKLGRVGYVCKGPVFDLGDVVLQQQAVQHLHRWAAQERLLYLVVELPYEGHGLADALDAVGYRPHPERLPPSGLMSATMVIDLAQGEEAMLRAMSRTKRRSVRHALASGLLCRQGHSKDVAVFRQLMLQLCARRNTAPTPPQPDFFEHLWQAFSDAGGVKLFVVEHEGVPVNTLFTFTFGRWVRAWKMGWSGRFSEKSPDEFIFWESIRWAKQHGYRWYDFVWVDREAAIRYQKGERPSATWQPDGMSFAKLGWGAEALVLPLPRSRFYHPVLHTLSRLGAYRLLDSRWLSRWAACFHRTRTTSTL
jgi:lipid II:glycine glycyltransferase (peptidoglycan interpeptide bridge formation enzyme)